MSWWVAVGLVAAVLVVRTGSDARVAALARTPPFVDPPFVSGHGAASGWRTGWGGWRRRGGRRVRTATAERAWEACGVLVEELRAGRDPGSALRCAAEVCEELGPVVQAHDLGADVPTALRRTGVPAWRRVAAAWQVSAHSGSGLAETVRAVADDLRAERTTRRVVASELASARATARLLVGLPVVALLVGSSGGATPWRFFVDGPVGAACGVAGVGLLLAGLAWIERIADAVQAQA